MAYFSSHQDCLSDVRTWAVSSSHRRDHSASHTICYLLFEINFSPWIFTVIGNISEIWESLGFETIISTKYESHDQGNSLLLFTDKMFFFKMVEILNRQYIWKYLVQWTKSAWNCKGSCRPQKFPKFESVWLIYSLIFDILKSNNIFLTNFKSGPKFRLAFIV